jgi:two-component sensor histidine kinase
LDWEVDDRLHPHSLHLTWRETGGPPVAPPSRTSFGTQLIQRVLAHEISGSAEVAYLPEGVVFKAIAPLVDSAENDNEERDQVGRRG